MEITTVFLSIITTIMLAGVPWAYLVHGRLTKIETKIETKTKTQTETKTETETKQ